MARHLTAEEAFEHFYSLPDDAANWTHSQDDDYDDAAAPRYTRSRYPEAFALQLASACQTAITAVTVFKNIKVVMTAWAYAPFHTKKSFRSFVYNHPLHRSFPRNEHP